MFYSCNKCNWKMHLKVYFIHCKRFYEVICRPHNNRRHVALFLSVDPKSLVANFSSATRWVCLKLSPMICQYLEIIVSRNFSRVCFCFKDFGALLWQMSSHEGIGVRQTNLVWTWLFTCKLELSIFSTLYLTTVL